MATIETLETKLRELPSDMLSEVEDFVEFLLEKRRRADFVVDTGSTLEASRAQVDTIIAALRGRGGEAYVRHWS